MRRCGSIALCCGLLAGCGGSTAPPAATSLAAAVPDPDLSEMEPQVAAFLGKVRTQLLENRGSAEAWGNLASLYDAHSLFDAAEVCYRHAIALAPDDFRWTYLLAILRDVRGAGADEETELFEAAAKLDPDYVPIYVRLGDALARQGRNEEARARLEHAAELGPEIAVTQRLLGQVALALGDLDAAVEHLTRAIELEPRDQAAHTVLAQVYMRKGQKVRAEEQASAAERLERVNVLDDPIYSRWVFDRSFSSSRALDRAKMRFRDGDFESAARDFELVVAAGRANADVHALLGECYAQLGHKEEALAQLDRAVALDPDHPAGARAERLRAGGG